MPQLTDQGRQIVAEQATHHQVSEDTVTQLLQALHRGGGTQAQFNLYELGGMGQWLQGGMVMVGDMFNTGLKSRVDSLCSDLATALSNTRMFESEAPKAWPDDLGPPAATGAQNDMRYAYFPDTQRLAVTQNSQTSLYDTAGHDIAGFSQSQSDSQSLDLTSQHGTIALSKLKKVQDNDTAEVETTSGHDQIIATIDRLAELRNRGVLTETEFLTKKSELLARM